MQQFIRVINKAEDEGNKLYLKATLNSLEKQPHSYEIQERITYTKSAMEEVMLKAKKK